MGAEQLQRVVLHHVAQGPGLVIEGAARLDAQVFGNRDLDVGNGVAPPQGLEQGVAKAQRKQVLYRRLAQVVVDAKNLVFAQYGGQRGVDRAVGLQVVPQGLFQHHARCRAVQPHRANLLGHRGEQPGGCGQVHDDAIGLTLAQQRSQPFVVGGLRQIHAQVVQHGAKLGKLLVAGPFGQLHPFGPLGHQLTVLGIAQIVAGHANNAAARRQRAVAKSLEQRRHQLAPGQITGSAKQHQIETHGHFLRNGTKNCNRVT